MHQQILALTRNLTDAEFERTMEAVRLIRSATAQGRNYARQMHAATRGVYTRWQGEGVGDQGDSQLAIEIRHFAAERGRMPTTTELLRRLWRP